MNEYVTEYAVLVYNMQIALLYSKNEPSRGLEIAELFYLSFGYRDSYEGGFDLELELGLVAFWTGALESSVVPGFGMILKGPIFFKTSDLNSIVSYDLGISLSQCLSVFVKCMILSLSLQKYKSFQVYFSSESFVFSV